jgi:hypothetical protein
MGSCWDVVVGSNVARNAAWSYPNPAKGYETVSSAFYPYRLDRCLLDDEVVISQEGDFYGGWITVDMIGRFKGAAGTSGL